ncbi:hypothetical protein PoB_000629200 [Plakobranchus ocellatus]|uniref:Uncharacterized protein n=1 Tax=Plakobranchus ocellatus TaxID=259542 RepID=A0AAV3YAE5_9GAST|nr:hypothetical protein PoB_000629200 [Plakobranchus ocellatus]
MPNWLGTSVHTTSEFFPTTKHSCVFAVRIRTSQRHEWITMRVVEVKESRKPYSIQCGSEFTSIAPIVTSTELCKVCTLRRTVAIDHTRDFSKVCILRYTVAIDHTRYFCKRFLQGARIRRTVAIDNTTDLCRVCTLRNTVAFDNIRDFCKVCALRCAVAIDHTSDNTCPKTISFTFCYMQLG